MRSYKLWVLGDGIAFGSFVASRINLSRRWLDLHAHDWRRWTNLGPKCTNLAWI